MNWAGTFPNIFRLPKLGAVFPLTPTTLFCRSNPTKLIDKFVDTKLEGRYKTLLSLCGDWKSVGHCSILIWKGNKMSISDRLSFHENEKINKWNKKHLLLYWQILARSSTFHFAGAVNTRQKITVHIISLVYSEFPNRSCRSVRSFISTLNCT